MTDDAIADWIAQAKKDSVPRVSQAGVRVIKRDAKQSRGQIIMQIAEKIRPHISKLFEGVRDENGMIVQPARVRGISLNVAQRIVQAQEEKLAG